MTTSLDSGAPSGTAVRGPHVTAPALERTGVDEVSVIPKLARHALEKRSNRAYCHLKIFRATTKLMTPQDASSANCGRIDDSPTPSSITPRSALLSAVSGNA